MILRIQYNFIILHRHRTLMFFNQISQKSMIQVYGKINQLKSIVVDYPIYYAMLKKKVRLIYEITMWKGNSIRKRLHGC